MGFRLVEELGWAEIPPNVSTELPDILARRALAAPPPCAIMTGLLAGASLPLPEAGDCRAPRYLELIEMSPLRLITVGSVPPRVRPSGARITRGPDRNP